MDQELEVILTALVGQSSEIQGHILKLANSMNDPGMDPDDKSAALDTIKCALFPNLMGKYWSIPLRDVPAEMLK